METCGELPHLLFDFACKPPGIFSTLDLEIFVSRLEFGDSEVNSVSISHHSVTCAVACSLRLWPLHVLL